jgi:hypothetical protein
MNLFGTVTKGTPVRPAISAHSPPRMRPVRDLRITIAAKIHEPRFHAIEITISLGSSPATVPIDSRRAESWGDAF